MQGQVQEAFEHVASAVDALGVDQALTCQGHGEELVVRAGVAVEKGAAGDERVLGSGAGELAEVGELLDQAPSHLDQARPHPVEGNLVAQLVGPRATGDVPELQEHVGRPFTHGDRGADHVVHSVLPTPAQVQELGRGPGLAGDGGPHAPHHGEDGERLGVGGEQQPVGHHQRESPGHVSVLGGPVGDGQDGHATAATDIGGKEPVGPGEVRVPQRTRDLDDGRGGPGGCGDRGPELAGPHLVERAGEAGQLAAHVGGVQQADAVDERLPVGAPAGLDAGVHQVEADVHRVLVGDVAGEHEVEHLVDPSRVPEIAGDHEEGVGLVAGPRQDVAVEDQGFGGVAPFEAIAGQPELRPPAAGHGGDVFEGGLVGLVAAGLAGEGDPPEEAVLEVGIGTRRLAERLPRPGTVTPLGVHLGQVGEDDARRAVLVEIAAENSLGCVQLAALEQHDAAGGGSALGVGVDRQQLVGRVEEVDREPVPQRLHDHAVQGGRLVPGVAQSGR